MFTYTAINKCSSYFHRRIFSSRPASLSTKWGDLLKRRNGVDFKERGMVLLSFGLLRRRGLKIGGLGHSPVAQLTERCTDVASAATNDQVRSGYNRFKPTSRHPKPASTEFFWFSLIRRFANFVWETLATRKSRKSFKKRNLNPFLFVFRFSWFWLSKFKDKDRTWFESCCLFFRLSFVASQGKKLMKKIYSAVAMLSGSVRRKDTGSCQPLSRLRASFQRRSPE